MKMMNDMELEQVIGGFTIEEFLDITNVIEAAQFLLSQGYGPGNEYFEHFINIWMKVNGNQ